MAKFAQVGYGSQGQGAGKSGTGYTYIVNDNVRAGDTIQPVVTHATSGKVFVTTGKTLSTTKNLSNERTLKQEIMNNEAKKQLKEKGYIRITEDGRVENVESVRAGDTGIKQAYTGKELGVKGFRGRTQQEQAKTDQYYDGEKPQTKYTQEVRAGNIAMQMKKDPNTQLSKNAQELFDEYSKKFMN